MRLAEAAEEKEALESRYLTALASAIPRGAGPNVERFDELVGNSSAIISMNVDVLKTLATDKALYTNYQLAVRAQIRRSAKMPFDQHRRAVDGKMWGSAGEQIRYGALSLDGRGLSSYGMCHVTLRESHISHRASVLERNTFDFLERVTSDQELPMGYRSSWAERHKVALAKCADEIEGSTPETDFPKVLLKSAKKREDDDFVEVHIYGSFDWGAVSAITIAGSPASRSDMVILEIVKDIAVHSGIGWKDGNS